MMSPELDIIIVTKELREYKLSWCKISHTVQKTAHPAGVGRAEAASVQVMFPFLSQVMEPLSVLSPLGPENVAVPYTLLPEQSS